MQSSARDISFATKITHPPITAQHNLRESVQAVDKTYWKMEHSEEIGFGERYRPFGLRHTGSRHHLMRDRVVRGPVEKLQRGLQRPLPGSEVQRTIAENLAQSCRLPWVNLNLRHSCGDATRDACDSPSGEKHRDQEKKAQ